MVILILIILLFLWGYSYMKFRSKMKFYSVMYSYLREEAKDAPSPENMLRLSGACLVLQRYKEAYDIYEQLLPIYSDQEKIETNIKFCANPIPGIHQPKNINQSWWHNFLLVRFGKKRYTFLTQDDHIKTEALMRLSRV